jgi:hypothetical protein
MKAKSNRVFLLARVFTHGLFQGAWWLVVTWIVAVVLFTWFVTWDGRIVVWCGIPQEPLAGAGSQEAMTRLLLSEYFCWGWVFVSLAFCLPNVLLPLATSHSISQVLWLRLTPTTPREMAVARICRLLLAASFLGLLGSSWGVICAIYHSVSPVRMLLLVSGFLTHLLVSGGLVLFFSQWARSDKARIVCVFVSFVLPCLSCLGYFAFQRQAGVWGEWWPYATPFTYVLGKDDKHLISCALLGLLLIIAYIAMQRGQAVLSFSHTREN